LAVMQLRESGTHDLRGHSLSRLSPGLAWRQVLTTEDAPFADDPMPPEIELPKGRIQFARPGAVLLRSMPAEGGE
jgi:hypothetical protein